MSFQSFNENWFDQLWFLIHHLNEAPKPPQTREEQRRLRDLVKKVMAHYEEYYQVKLAAAAHDVLDVFVAPWCTSVERSLMWIGGWRPTTAFQLIYTEMGIFFENNTNTVDDEDNMVDILRGLRNDKLGDLSTEQFDRVCDLHGEILQLENSIGDELSNWQDSLCELLGPKADVDKKMEDLLRIVSQADDLRLKTIKKVVDLLTLSQAAEFVVTASELQFGVRIWGTDGDRT